MPSAHQVQVRHLDVVGLVLETQVEACPVSLLRSTRAGSPSSAFTNPRTFSLPRVYAMRPYLKVEPRWMSSGPRPE